MPCSNNDGLYSWTSLGRIKVNFRHDYLIVMVNVISEIKLLLTMLIVNIPVNVW